MKAAQEAVRGGVDDVTARFVSHVEYVGVFSDTEQTPLLSRRSD